jgi:hypothetical protein
MPEKACATETQGDVSHSKVIHELSETAPATVRVLTLEAFTDPEWRYLYGSVSDVEIASYINTADVIYRNQLGITLRLNSITNFTNSTLETSPNQMLNAFRLSPEAQGQANVKTLFTGKDMDGATVGIAYVGSVCYAKGFEYSVIQSYGILTGNIFTHELGHSLGARHDYYNVGSVMYPYVSLGDARFSSQSLSEINSFLGYVGSCFATESTGPLLEESVLTATKVKSSIVLRLSSRDGQAVKGKGIVYRANNAQGVRSTSSNGSITLRVKGKGTVVVRAYVQDAPTVKVVQRFKF